MGPIPWVPTSSERDASVTSPRWSARSPTSRRRSVCCDARWPTARGRCARWRSGSPRRRAGRPSSPSATTSWPARCARRASSWSRSRRRSTGSGSRPSGYGVFLDGYDDGTVDVFTGGRKLRVSVSPNVEVDELQRGQEVMLNEAINVVAARGFERAGDVVMLKELLEPTTASRRGRWSSGTPTRSGSSSSPTPCIGAAAARRRLAAAGDPLGVRLRADPEERGRGARPRRGPRHRLLRHRWPVAADRADPRRRRAAVPARGPVPRARAAAAEGHPALRPARLRQDADRQGGGQLAGQEGRRAHRRRRHEQGKSYFLNIKGPELLNKYVGETERHIRLVFQRAREKASEGTPVIVFFDEMDSIFRTRGSGVSSDVENTIVPQLLSEIDGVEGLENVIVIGASNREDMIDPAILRPGRLDVKIKIERPDAEAARGHLQQVHDRRRCRSTPTTSPSTAAAARRPSTAMIQRTVERMYTETRGEPVPRGHLRQR